jgi:hypothetical protein
MEVIADGGVVVISLQRQEATFLKRKYFVLLI